MMYRYALAFVICAIAFSAFAAENDVREERAQVVVVVPAHDIARGAVIAESDLTRKAMPALRINNSIVQDAADASGREAKRALRAGELMRTSDLKRPTLVAKGSTVTMVFEAPGVKLTSVGRALAEGGEGDSIPVLNPTSYRQVVALVTGPGSVRVGPLPQAVATPAHAAPRLAPVPLGFGATGNLSSQRPQMRPAQNTRQIR